MSFSLPILRSDRRRDISAQPGQTVFNFDLPLFDPSDLAVSLKVAPAASFTRLLSGFTVALSASLANATVTFDQAPAANAGQSVVVRLEGRRVQDRLSNVTRGGVFNSAALERDQDRVSIVLQELRRDVDDLATAAASVVTATNTAVTIWQLRQALAFFTKAGVTEQAVLAAPDEASRIAWASRGRLAVNDVFLAFIGGAQPNPLPVILQRATTFAELPGVSAYAFMTTLLNSGWYFSVDAAVPADPDDPTRIDWETGQQVSPIGRVMALTVKAVGLDAIAAQALYAAAGLVTAVGTDNPVTARQFRAALAMLGQLWALETALQEPDNPYLVDWKAQDKISASDPLVSGFVVPTLSLSSAQKAALFVLASTAAFGA
jgi:hypothetical protein